MIYANIGIFCKYENMNNNKWKTRDELIDMHALMQYFGVEGKHDGEGFSIYTSNREQYVVFRTEKGYRYYRPSKPEIKYGAFDFIHERLSRTEKTVNSSIWEKLEAFYDGLEDNGLLSKGPKEKCRENMFNHFRGYGERFSIQVKEEGETFGGRIYEDANGTRYFPLYNLTNTLTGYWKEEKDGTVLIGESNATDSIWFSNVPQTIDNLMVFSNPMEAIEFHRRFQLKNVVYISLGKINYSTSRIMMELHKKSKVSKVGLSFTGSTKIAGYVDDLMMLSFLNDTKFLVRTEDNGLRVQFDPEKEQVFAKLFKEIKKYNDSLMKGYMAYNALLDQMTVNKKKIVIGRHKDMMVVKIPFDVVAIRYFLWSYYRNYMGKVVEILKPKTNNWKNEFKTYGAYEGKQLKEEHRIAV